MGQYRGTRQLVLAMRLQGTAMPVSGALLRYSFFIVLTVGALPSAAAQLGEEKCPYPVAHAAALRSQERVVDSQGRHTRYRVEFNGIRCDRVPGYLYVPRNVHGRCPAVLLEYGSGASKDNAFIVALGRRFAENGFVVLTADVPLRGERAPPATGPLSGLAIQFDRFDRDRFTQTCGDYSRALDYLDTRPEVDPSRMAYVGISWGAITGITFAAYEPRLKVMVSMVGGGGFLEKILGGPHPQLAARELDPVNQVGKIAPRPLLLLNATQDHMIPRMYAEALQRATGPGAKIVWVETDHNFRGTDHERVAPAVLDFVEEHQPRK